MLLIISPSKKRARAVSDTFYYMGMISYAVTPNEALSEISDLYRAILMLDPEDIPDAEEYTEKLRAYNKRIPIFGIFDSEAKRDINECFDAVFTYSACSCEILDEVVRYQRERCLPISAHYRLAGIDASCYSNAVSVFNERLDLTKTETMILRYLISTYPMPKSAGDIIKYAFKPTRRPEITSIRTHVCVINRKFRDLRGKNLFVNVPMQGYAICTPEESGRLAEVN